MRILAAALMTTTALVAAVGGAAAEELEDGQEPLTISVHAGVPLERGIDLVAHVGGMLIEDRREVRTISQSVVVGALRVWPHDRVWVEAGFGAARLNVERDNRLDVTSMSNIVPATAAGV